MYALRSAVLKALTIAALVLSLVPHAVYAVPQVEVERGALVMHGDVLERAGRPYSGWVIERSGESVVERLPMLEGRAEGRLQRFYPNGALHAEGSYTRGHREGEHRFYWPDGSLQSVRRYHQDRFEGEQLAFFRDGRPAESLHFTAGYEDGTQQVWEADGSLRVNYTVVGGRRYGIVGRMDCVSRTR